MMDSLALEALQGIGLSAPLIRQLPALADDDPRALLRVVEVQRDHVLLHDGQSATRGRVAPALRERLQHDDDALAVGDWVLARPDGSGALLISERLAPLTQLARLTNDGRGGPRRQVLVSNVDTALLVMGLDQDFNLRRLERYLALVRQAGVAAVLLLTKADQADPARLARCLEQARANLPTGVDLLAVDGRDADAATRLQPWLVRGQTLVLLGSSGAGKSTLVNTLTGGHGQSTGPVRADDSRGRHTTTVRSLHRSADGACLIDTPGLRALRLDLGDEDALAEVFGDVAQWAGQCRFRDCRHLDEPGCAVREAVPAQRLRSFHKLQREAQRDGQTALQRREEVRLWKARGRAAEFRLRAKRSG